MISIAQCRKLLRYRHMGAYLRGARLAHDMSLQDVCEHSGIAAERLSRVERGHTTLGHHHWDSIARAIPGVDARILAIYARRQNSVSCAQRALYALRRLHQRRLLHGVFFVAGVAFGLCAHGMCTASLGVAAGFALAGLLALATSLDL